VDASLHLTSMARMTSIARTSRCLCAALLLVPWAAAHPANAALRLAASGLRLRDGAAAHGGAALSLGLRGGGAVPGVTWSQRQDSLMVKVEIPAGASLDALRLAGDDDVIEWADDAVSLSLDLYAKLDKGSLARTDGGRQVTLNVKKADPAWWPKLTKGPKPGNVKVDWASWKDEDEGAFLGPGPARACRWLAPAHVRIRLHVRSV